jgi:outer membrane protein assembly factor BamB
MSRSLLVSLLTFAFAPAARADWPQWRGPNRDGHALGARLPAQWPAQAPKPAWKVHVGQGYAGAAVARGRVFIIGRDDEKKEEHAYCFDLAGGKQLWEFGYPAPFVAPDPTAGRGPNANPTVDGDRVYFFGLSGMLTCADVVTGKVLWRHDCLKEYWGVKTTDDGDDAWFPPCGASASPLVDGNTVIVPVGGPKAGAVTGFDRATGKLLWKALDDRSSYASPLIASPGGVKQVVAFTGTRMVGLRHSDRELLWDEPFKTRYEQTIISPVVWKDRVVIGGEAKPTLCVELTRDGNRVKKKLAWKSDDLKLYTATPILVGDHLIGYDHRTKRLACLSMATGETAWTSPNLNTKHLSLVAAGNTLLVLTAEGELHAARVSEKGYEPLAKWKAADRGTWAHLSVTDNRLLVKGPTPLLCYELR